MESIEEKHNPLFDRKEVRINIERDSPPKKEEAVKIVSEKLSVPEETVHIDKIDGKFGTNDFMITAEVYTSKEEKERLNSINKKKKKAAKA
jgi:ribosomal protein S24E